MTLTHDKLIKLLWYNKKTGLFTWKPRGVKNWDVRYAYKVAGTMITRKNKKYIEISIDNKKYLAHRLAIFYVSGLMPEPELLVDHKNGNGICNKYNNLRKVTVAENNINLCKYKNNKSGVCGVYKRNNKWIASYTLNKKSSHIGTFNNKKDAKEARKAINKKFFLENHGK